MKPSDAFDILGIIPIRAERLRTLGTQYCGSKTMKNNGSTIINGMPKHPRREAPADEVTGTLPPQWPKGEDELPRGSFRGEDELPAGTFRSSNEN